MFPGEQSPVDLVGVRWYIELMWAYARSTLREAVTSALAWLLLGVGAFAGWFATTLAILAIERAEDQARDLVVGTSQLFGVLVTLAVLGRLQEEDGDSGFALAADAARPGPFGRVLGRWVGGTAAGVVAATGVALLTSATGAVSLPSLHYLLTTSICACGMVGAWVVLLGTRWNAVATTIAVLALWVIGHLPWSTLGGGKVGAAIAVWLPGPRDTGGALSTLGYTSAATAGLLLLTLALVRPVEPRT